MKYLKVNGKTLSKMITKILVNSPCGTIETNVCTDCSNRVNEIRKLLNKCKG